MIKVLISNLYLHFRFEARHWHLQTLYSAGLRAAVEENVYSLKKNQRSTRFTYYYTDIPGGSNNLFKWNGMRKSQRGKEKKDRKFEIHTNFPTCS